MPRYLQHQHHATLRDRVDNVTIHREIATTFLAEQAKASVDAFVLLDAQDWMNDQQLNALWSEIDRTAGAGARVIFRTAGQENILLSRVSPTVLQHWYYEEELSKRLHQQDRSAIYGGFHLMRRTST